MNIDWEPLIELIGKSQRFVLTSHVRPDADAVGSELALAMALEQLGKNVRIINPSALGAHLEFLDPDHRVETFANPVTFDEAVDTDVHIVLDTSAWIQLGKMDKVIRKTAAQKVIVDHHVSSDSLGAQQFKDPQAEATGSLVFGLINALGAEVTKPIATALYCAIATDTGWFRFSSTTGETMRIIGSLVDFGASPAEIFALLYEQNSLARVHLAGRVLSRVEVVGEGRLAYTFVEWKDFEQLGAHPSDTEDLVNECLKIAGTECALIAVEQRTKQVKFSLRSRSGVDVAAIAEKFGGGGHRQASGAMVAGPLPTAVERVLAAMKTALG